MKPLAVALLAALTLACDLSLTRPLSAGEKLLYAIRHTQSPPLPITYRTQIFSVDPHAKERVLVFTDEKTPIMVLGQADDLRNSVVAARTRIFARGAERRLWDKEPTSSIYELSRDGSNRVRQVATLLVPHSDPFVDPTGTKIGYLTVDSSSGGAYGVLVIHETETGQRVRNLDAYKLFSDCDVFRIGYLPDGNRLFFSLGEGALATKECERRVGDYVMNDDGSRLVKLRFGPIIGPFPLLVGAFPDGSFLFETLGTATSFLYRVDPRAKSPQKILLKNVERVARADLSPVKLSRSGRYIAFTEPIYKHGATHLWIHDLQSGEGRRVFSLTQQPYMAEWLLFLVGWIQD